MSFTFWKVVFFIYCCIEAFFVIVNLIKAEKKSKDTLSCYIGTMGSGKTYLAVHQALQVYYKQRKRYKRTQNKVYGWIFRFLYPDHAVEPHLFSNIPVLVKWRFRKKKRVYCEILTAEHLALERRIPPNSTVLIDEISLFMNQYEFDNPSVMEKTAMLFRFCRQWDMNKVILTDQSLSIVKPVRERIGVAYMLHNFDRYHFTPFYKVTTVPLVMVADESTQVNEDFSKFFFGLLPYKWWQRLTGSKKYDTKCYSPIYYDGWNTTPPQRFTDLKTTYVLDITASNEDKASYKRNKKAYRNDFMTNLANIP